MKNAKKRSARVGSQADISATKGPIDMRQTRMHREMDSMTKSQRTKSQKTKSQKTISQKTKSQMDKSQEDKSQIS